MKLSPRYSSKKEKKIVSIRRNSSVLQNFKTVQNARTLSKMRRKFYFLTLLRVLLFKLCLIEFESVNKFVISFFFNLIRI